MSRQSLHDAVDVDEPTGMEPDAADARDRAVPFALAAFLARWADCANQDLAASDSQTVPLATLLRFAGAEDLRRWQAIGLGYADPRGTLWLRVAIAARYRSLAAEDVLACNGAQEALTCVLRTLLGPDDHAIVVVPIYQPSELAVTGLCRASGVPLDPDRGWSLDLDRLAGALRPNTRLVLANFPNSPTGASMDQPMLDGLIAFCRRHGLWLVNDEVYRQTDAGVSALPVVDSYERGVSINGLSKGFGLPGLRVGWAGCRDRRLLDRALVQKSLLSSCLSGPSEVLAHIALQVEGRLTAWARSIGRRNHRRLRLLIERCPDVFEADAPANWAFAFPRFRGTGEAAHFAEVLARQAGLLVLPSGLWQSRLAPVPTDRVRLGLGRLGSGAALDVLEHHLIRSNERQGVAGCTR